MTWFLRGSLDDRGPDSVRSERFAWQREALQRAADLFDQYGSRIRLEISLTEDGKPIRDARWLSNWNKTGRELPPKP